MNPALDDVLFRNLAAFVLKKFRVLRNPPECVLLDHQAVEDFIGAVKPGSPAFGLHVPETVEIIRAAIEEQLGIGTRVRQCERGWVFNLARTWLPPFQEGDRVSLARWNETERPTNHSHGKVFIKKMTESNCEGGVLCEVHDANGIFAELSIAWLDPYGFNYEDDADPSEIRIREQTFSCRQCGRIFKRAIYPGGEVRQPSRCDSCGAVLPK